MSSAPRLDDAVDSLQQQARALYECSEYSLDQIAEKLGISSSSLRRLRRTWNWPLRPPLRTRRALNRGPKPTDDTNLNEELLIHLRRELQAVEAMVLRDPHAISPAAAAEKRARTLSSLIRSYSDIQRLKRGASPQPEESDDAFPTSLEELRAELARRIDRLRDAAREGDSD